FSDKTGSLPLPLVPIEGGTSIYSMSLSTGEFSLVASAPSAAVRAIGGISVFGDTLVATDAAAPVVFRVNLVTKEVATVAGLAYTPPSDQAIRPLAGATGLWRRGDFIYVADNSRSLIYKVASRTGESATFRSDSRAPLQMWREEEFVYVTQPSDNRVIKISFETGQVTTVTTELTYPTFISGD